MKVFVAGSSGAMGRRLVPRLVAGGYEVVAMTRDDGKAAWLCRVGAQPVMADALDRAAVADVVKASEPEVVIHQLTALSGAKSFKNFDKEFALTNRLRTEGTDYLLEAAQAAGVRRVVAQSYGNWNYKRTGSAVKTEQDPFDSHPPANQVKSLQAIRYVENAVVNAGGIEGIALRYGNFYGPGTGLDLGGDIVAQVRKRMFPIVGDGAGIWSFVHTWTMLRRPRWQRSSTAGPACTTSPTTSRRRPASGCPISRRWSAPSRRATSLSGWDGWPLERSAFR